MSLSLPEAAARLVADLMPIAIVVADTGEPAQAAAFLAALEQAGAGAEKFAGNSAGAFDLAILLAGSQPPRDPVIPALIESLAAISDRLLFIPVANPGANPVPGPGANPVPSPGANPVASAPAAGIGPDLDAWFELFAEQGYQPVVDYDANFLGQGAFLVDRNATAAENDLSAFAERLSMGGALAASTQRVAVLEAELGTTGDREAIKAELTARQADLAAALVRENAWRSRAEVAEAELGALKSDLAGWQNVAHALGDWIRSACVAPERTTLAALRTASGKSNRPRLLRRLMGLRGKPKPGRVEKQQLADALLIRASTLFDPGWYIASRPELAAGAADPVWHYILRGAQEGADPGPWFDTNAYRAAHPEAIGNPLAHAIRQGHVDRPPPGN